MGPVTAHDAAASARLLALLDALFAEAPVGLAFFDLELRYVRVNERLAEINGVPAADHIGRTVDDVLPEMDARVTEGFRRVLETSEPIVDVEVVGATPREPGLTRRWLASYYPLDGPDGERIGLGADARRHDPARRRGAARLVVAGRDNRSCAGAAHLGVAGRGSGPGARAATLGGRCRPRW